MRDLAGELFCTKVAFVVCVVSMAACGSPTVPTLDGYRLTGTVLQQTAAGMIPRAGITILETTQGRSGVTDARGRYTVPGLKAGVVHIRIDFSVFVPVERDIRIDADTVVDLQLIPKPLFTLSGRITEMTADGPIPVSGVQVGVIHCLRANRVGEVTSGESTADGSYEVRGVCEGQAIVFFYKNGYTYSSPNMPQCDFDGECRWVVVTGDTRRDEILVRTQ